MLGPRAASATHSGQRVHQGKQCAKPWGTPVAILTPHPGPLPVEGREKPIVASQIDTQSPSPPFRGERAGVRWAFQPSSAIGPHSSCGAGNSDACKAAVSSPSASQSIFPNHTAADLFSGFNKPIRNCHRCLIQKCEDTTTILQRKPREHRNH